MSGNEALLPREWRRCLVTEAPVKRETVPDDGRTGLRAHALAPREIGNGARHPQHPVVAARGEPEAPRGTMHQGAFGLTQRAVALGLVRREPGARGALACILKRTGRGDMFSNPCRGFTRHRLRPVDVVGPGQSLHQEVQVVEEGAGYSRGVAYPLGGRARTAIGPVAEMAAGTRIHRADQLEACGEVRAPRRAGDRHPARLQRLAQDVQHMAVELRQFVEKKDSRVGERNLPGSWDRASVRSRNRMDKADDETIGYRPESTNGLDTERK